MENDQYTLLPVGTTIVEVPDTIPWTPALLLQRWQTSTKLERQNLLGRHDVLNFMEELLIAAVSADKIAGCLVACGPFNGTDSNIESPYHSDIVNECDVYGVENMPRVATPHQP